jgi:hypothetical protein
MRWRAVLEVTGTDGAVRTHEIGGGAAVDEYLPHTIGLSLAEGKRLLAGLQLHVIQAQTEDHCGRRRRCQRCGTPRPIKDKRSRRLSSLFGTVDVSAPRFKPCGCAVTCRQTLSPVSETMPDRCTPEYERVVAKMGASQPYRRALTMLAEFLRQSSPFKRATPFLQSSRSWVQRQNLLHSPRRMARHGRKGWQSR